MATYIGFSTVGRDTGPFTLTDIDLVKQDLLNALTTARGERVMRPEWGTIIYDLLMDPFDDSTREGILNDVRRIIDSEPRVELMNIDSTESEHAIRVDIELLFTPQDVVDVLRVEYDRRNREDI